MSLLSWWRGRRIKLTDGAFWASWFGSSNWSGKSVTPDGAMELSTWWACVRRTSETVGTLPIGVFEKDGNGSKNARTDHPLYGLLHDSPNADQTAVEYWEGVVASLCIWGNSYSRKEYEGVGSRKRLVALHPIATDTMVVSRENNGALRYRYTERNRAYDQGEDEIFHIRGFGAGGDLGLSPVAYARQTLGISMATEEATGKTFAQGMRAPGFFTAPVTLTPEQRIQAKKVLVDPYSGNDATGKAGILEAGFGWISTNIPPKDAEMLLSRRFNVEEICRWFCMPPILIGHAGEGQTMWGSGVEQIMLGWLTLGLRPYLSRIEKAISKRLIAPGERSKIAAEFAVEGLLRGDSGARAAFFSTMVQNGIYTRNFARALENLPPMDGGDMLTVQSNLLPIELLGKAPAPAPQPAPDEPILEPAS